MMQVMKGASPKGRRSAPPKLAQAPMEISEALEQLRALWHGYKIAVHLSDSVPGPGVDTPQDLERVRRLLAQD